MKNNYFEDPNSLHIIANDLTVEPIIDERRGYRALKPGIKITIPHYDLQAVLISILEDYTADQLIKLINELENN